MTHQQLVATIPVVGYAIGALCIAYGVICRRSVWAAVGCGVLGGAALFVLAH